MSARWQPKIQEEFATDGKEPDGINMLRGLRDPSSVPSVLNSSAVYSEKVLDHFQHPRNVGEIERPAAVVEVTNPVCGDLLKLCAVAENGRIAAIKFKCAGCVPAVACGSWLTERVLGRPIEELSSITADEIEEALGGVPPASRHACELAVASLKRLIENLPSVDSLPGRPRPSPRPDR